MRNVPHAAKTFLRHLVRLPGWETLRVTDAAATVQRPADQCRGPYERWVQLATGLTERLWGSAATVVPVDSVGSAGCGPLVLVAGGKVAYPVPVGLIGTNRDNWGGHRSHWNSWHTGTESSVPFGTSVLTATGGTIEIGTSQSWAGRWLAKVVTGRSSLSTW